MLNWLISLIYLFLKPKQTESGSSQSTPEDIKRMQQTIQERVDHIFGEGKCWVKELIHLENSTTAGTPSATNTGNTDGAKGVQFTIDDDAAGASIPQDGSASQTTVVVMQASFRRYIVYIDYQDQVQCLFQGTTWGMYLDAKKSESHDVLNTLFSLASELKALPCSNFYLEHKLAFRRMVGHIFLAACELDAERAKKHYQEAREYYQRRSTEIFRQTQIGSTFDFLVLALIVLLGLHYFFHIELLSKLCCMMAAGLFGNFYQIFKRAGESEFDAECSTCTIVLDSLARCVVAMGMGVLGWCVIQTQLLTEALTCLQAPDTKFYAAMCVAFLAGMSNSLIPSLLHKAIPLNHKA